ncbi:37S ribosomal protein Rsm22 [Plectosphaerella plurivora]|uniref:37S ribosomal protein Rsm22 n=1 Tax=Plectosphaerella plurivora TaxID=936078 RepID=A0A9P8V8K7_9PEZI|nr:37S ribosomal protein Rsm22 [Plectosphaerella plurivora]
MSKMLAAGSLRRSLSSSHSRAVRLAFTPVLPSQSIHRGQSRFRASTRPSTHQFSTFVSRSQHHSTSNDTDVQSNGTTNEGRNTSADIEAIVHEARQRFRDTLPAGYLTEEEYSVYVRLYGPPLRETEPEDVGIPFPGVRGPEPRREPGATVLLKETEGSGEYEEIHYAQTRTTNAGDTAESESKDLATEDVDGPETLSEAQATHIQAVARNQREYEALIKLQRDFEAANLEALREAEELEQQDANTHAETVANHDDEVLQREIEEAALYEERAQLSAAALHQLQAAARGEEEDPLDVGDDVELAADRSRTPTHAWTQRGRFSTNPRTLLLPQTTFTRPIAELLDRTSITHIREAAEAALGGGGLPNSPSTPASRKSGPQQAVGLESGQTRMTPIEADVFLATILPAAYASTMSALVEVRKRLGAEWMRDLLRRTEGPRVLDVGGGGAGLAAWQDVSQAEWSVMRDNREVEGANPPGKQSVIVGSDTLRNRISRFLHNTSFLPRVPDYVHSADIASQNLDAPRDPLPKKTYDVVLVSYALLQTKEGHRRKAMLAKLWSLLSPEGGVLIFVEKGHPRGFEAIGDVREKLIQEYMETPIDSGIQPTVTDPTDPSYTRPKEPGMIIAPCTTHNTCPMYTTPGLSAGRKDFCSFQQRFYRPKFLQQVLRAKHSNHDDVRFSYVAIQRGVKPEGLLVGEEATKRAFEGYEHSEEAPNTFALPRQVLPPLKRKGHVQLEVCTPSGRIERWTVPKSRGKQSYHDARKAVWGDLWALGAKVRTPRQVRMGRSVADDDGGVRAQQAHAKAQNKVRTVSVDMNSKGHSSTKDNNRMRERRTKGGRKSLSRSLREELDDGKDQ